MNNSIFNFKSIKGKLILAFLAFFVMNICVTVAVVWSSRVSSRLARMSQLINKVNLQIKEAEKVQKDFFGYETINSEFHLSRGESYLIRTHKSIIKDVKNQLITLESLNEDNILDVDTSAQLLIKKLNEYDIVFDTLISLTLDRGFKDYGTVGKMRKCIHAIEHTNYTLDKSKILMARRHEKDFIIRKDEKYVGKLGEAVAVLEEEIKTQIPEPARTKYLSLLYDYKLHFNQLVEKEKQIGYHHQDGLRAKVPQLSDEIEAVIEDLHLRSSKQAESMMYNTHLILILIAVSSVVISVILGLFVVRRLGKPIENLSNTNL